MQPCCGIFAFSPRMWRCFLFPLTYRGPAFVFSTHVAQEFSPRMWRCFFPCIAMNAILRVFSTHVEMFLLLQVRKNRFIMFSPRMWRCFALYPSLMIKYNVFSTHVEMFLYHPKQLTHKLRFLHACGDVSISLRVKLTLVQFSPRMWRCFLPQDGSHRQ